jgi:hypothetical protein
MWVGLAVVIALLINTRKIGSGSINDGIHSISTIIIAATIAVLFYAKYGVDMLDQKYIALFYYSAPALAVCVTLIFIKERYLKKLKNSFVAIASVGFLCLTFNDTNQLPEYAPLYNQPEVVDMYDAMKATKTDGRLVLYLDASKDWGDVWSNILGVEIYAKRRGVDLFCVNKNWHISFTKDAICTQTEVLKNKRFWVEKTGGGNKYSAEPKFQKFGLDFFEISWPTLIGRGYVSVADNPIWYSAYFLKDGWSDVESQWVWMQNDVAHLALPLKSGFSGTVALDLSAYLPKPETTQRTDIYLNDKLYAQADFSAARNRQSVNLEIHDFAGEMADLKIVDHMLQSPKANGVSEDARTLGVGLYGFEIQEH